MATKSEKLDTIAKEQEKIGKQIVQLLTNAKKDSSTRKTEAYIANKTAEREKLLDQANENHLKALQIGMAEHVYFTSQYFDQIKGKHEELKEYLKDCPKAIADIQSNKSNEEVEQQFRIKKQMVKMEQLKHTVQQIRQELTECKTKYRYEALFNKVQKQWDAIQDLNEEIMVYETLFTHEYFVMDKYLDMETQFETVMEELDIKTKEISVNTLDNVKSNVALPKIKIPFFDGNYENWCSFHDIFQKVIHETSLSKTEKMQYLKTNLKGEAFKLIQHFKITEDNYEVAWNILQNRYENKRHTLSTLLDKILDLPISNRESPTDIKLLHDVTAESLQAIKNLGVKTDYWGPLLTRIIMRKWDPDTNRIYEQNLTKPNEIPQFEDVMMFLERRFQSLEKSGTVKKPNELAQTDSKPKIQDCGYCKQSHSIYHCSKFKNLSVADRNQFIRNSRLCYNCMVHDSKERCHSSLRCRTCGMSHHSMLHKDKKEQTRLADHGRFARTTNSSRSQTNTTIVASQLPLCEPESTSTHIGREDNTVLLPTAMVKVQTSNGMFQLLRVLVDQGSQSSFITEEAAQLLNLPRQKIQAAISGLGDGETKISRWKIKAEVNPRFSSIYTLTVHLLVLPKLTQTLPKEVLPNIDMDKWQNKLIADPTFNKPGPIDILLGAEEYAKIILPGLHKTEDGIIAQNTELGWIMSGLVQNAKSNTVKIISMIVRSEEDKQLTKFWELEEVNPPKYLNQDDQLCEQFYQQTTNRNKDGTYTVRIPFSSSEMILGNSKTRAAARLFQLEKKLSRNENLDNDYKEFLREYENMGHMTQVTSNNLNLGKYYIPHQAVIKESSTTTKLRVVFDASSKTDLNTSLNDKMYAGPKLQQELSEILLRWRKHSVAFTADIEKMYRQIKIHPEDRDYQRILWRRKSSDKIEEHQLNTVTYGTKAAPYLAIRTLQQLAKDEEDRFPVASKIILNDFYVDDLLSGASNKHEAVKLQKELITTLKSGGFTLRKWSSNCPEIIETLPEYFKDNIIQLAEDETRKSLGVLWSPIDDTFRFQTNVSNYQNLTKRVILSEIAKLFDPLGLLAPVVIQAKLLIQELWLQELAWDQPVTKQTTDQWLEFTSHIKAVEDLRIPRWLYYDETHTELHGFCDASEKAYGAVVYTRTCHNGKVYISLVHAKSKVAPARTKTTLPRLELCSAVLLSKLLHKVKQTLNLTDVSIYAWTDSMIALGWIRGDPLRWKTFVANRASDIQKLVPPYHWSHVKSDENPADCISRGMDPLKLSNHTLWWKGPEWLQETKKWPQTPIVASTNEEVKRCYHINVKYSDGIWCRFSSLTRMIRVLSYCRRFLKDITFKGPLKYEETHDTLMQVIKLAQSEELKDDYQSLIKSKVVHKHSKILALNPFIDNIGMIRVGGRLEHSQLSYTRKHPIIMPYHSHLTTLIIRDAHQRTLHGGIQATLAYLKQRYWIVNCKKAIKSIIHKCTKCSRYKAQAAYQQMGELPQPRVSPNPPFTHTGVDYAGPIQVRATKGRGHKSYKGYIAVFVCLSTKAIHLEVVSDMSTDTFLAAFKRFLARRGPCSHMYSDNGTTFVGANNHLQREIINMSKQLEIQNMMTTTGIQWHFIPPASPHFGGLWEAGVKSMKHHLRRTIGEATLTYEELTTLTHQIEAALNSRPLCPLTEDINDTTTLTPGHFLIGRELIAPPNPIDTSINTNLSQRWRLVQKIKKDFWKAWSMEYLTRLQQRYKWKTRKDNLQIGDIVIIKEDNINPSQWPLARVIQTHPATDGTIRVVTLRKAGGTTLKRNIHNLVPLPIENDIPPEITTKVSTNTNIAVTRCVINLTDNPIDPLPHTSSNTSCLTKDSPTHQYRKSCIFHLFLWLMVFLSVTSKAESKYVIHHPHPGIYVEHLGHARLDRGIFRIQLNFENDRLEKDLKDVSIVVQEFNDLCKKTKALSDETQCTSLSHHLKEQEEQLSWYRNSLPRNTRNRIKRGILGKFLTSVFGVNDEVYQDIDALQQNQQDLIKASGHQTKFMISTLSKVNETEKRINNQLERFRVKLNQGLAAINEMQRWYKSVDINRLNIHLLSTYQVACNFLTELNEYYSKLLDVHFNRGTLYDLISPSYISHIIVAANKKLPSNLQILPTPILRMKMDINETHIQIFASLPIVDIAEFALLQATPTPLQIDNGSYWTLDIPSEVIGVEYNTQLYFQLTSEEFKNCICLGAYQYICSPAVVKNIETNSNCVINDIYERPDTTHCKIKKHRATQLTWKQLHMPNTWLFITSKPTNVAIICQGIREDVRLNSTGIIQISQDCIIQTKQNILSPKRLETVPVLGSYSKALAPTINTTVKLPSYDKISEETVFKLTDNLGDIRSEEEALQTESQEKIWKKLHQHTYISNGITAVIIGTIALCIWFGYRIYNNKKKQKIQHQSEQPEMIELQPLR